MSVFNHILFSTISYTIPFNVFFSMIVIKGNGICVFGGGLIDSTYWCKHDKIRWNLLKYWVLAVQNG